MFCLCGCSSKPPVLASPADTETDTISKWKNRPSAKLRKVDLQPGLAQFVTMADLFRKRNSACRTLIKFDAVRVHLVSEVGEGIPSAAAGPGSRRKLLSKAVVGKGSFLGCRSGRHFRESALARVQADEVLRLSVAS